MRSMLLVVSALIACKPDGNEGNGNCNDAFFVDADSDGYGDPFGDLVTACSVPAGYAELGGDCDDANTSIHPHVDETCDAIDNDCDGVVDDEAVDALDWFADTDGDEFGDPLVPVQSCTPVAGYAAIGTDCDDTSAAVNPGADEVCNGLDDDCDESIDSDDASLVDGEVWYPDADLDLFGDAASGAAFCMQPAGTVSDGTDCDDTDDLVHPGAAEVCDDVDNDCDTLFDDDDPDLTSDLVFYADTDGDGWGDPAVSMFECDAAKAGYVANADDCDDTTADVGEAGRYYWDEDGDGYGFTKWGTTATCTPGPQDVLLDGDCEPYEPLAYPGAPEICDWLDNDCNGLTDGLDPAVIYDTWYGDTDGDGYGDPGVTLATCYEDEGYAPVADDCNDADATIHPSGIEYCDSIDNDCSGLADDGVVYVDWYGDGDGDGFGDAADVANDCAAPKGYVMDGTDCDDDVDTVYPGAPDACSNKTDDDCDGQIDNCEFALATADLTVVGAADYDMLGASLAAGDLDADGTSDLIMGAPVAGGETGRVYVLYGPQTGVVSSAKLATFSTSAPGAYLGLDVAVGDADGDGIGDLLTGQSTPESAYLFKGPLTAGKDVADADVSFADGGYSVAISPDLDGDTVPDIVLGAPELWEAEAGRVYVVSGDLSGSVALATDATYVYEGTAVGSALGAAVTHIGDGNGDGIDELALGAVSWAFGGRVYVVEGGATPGDYDVDVAAIATISGPPLTRFGDRMTGADYDGDGLDDLFAGDWLGDEGDGSGLVFAFLGPLSGAMDATSAATTWDSVEVGAEIAAVSAGDADGDGSADVLIGARMANGGVGSAYLQLGLASGVVDVASLISFPAPAESLAGYAVELLPDWEGDGGSEIAVGAIKAVDAAETMGGAVYVLQSGSLSF